MKEKIKFFIKPFTLFLIHFLGVVFFYIIFSKAVKDDYRTIYFSMDLLRNFPVFIILLLILYFIINWAKKRNINIDRKTYINLFFIYILIFIFDLLYNTYLPIIHLNADLIFNGMNMGMSGDWGGIMSGTKPLLNSFAIFGWVSEFHFFIIVLLLHYLFYLVLFRNQKISSFKIITLYFIYHVIFTLINDFNIGLSNLFNNIFNQNVLNILFIYIIFNLFNINIFNSIKYKIYENPK